MTRLSDDSLFLLDSLLRFAAIGEIGLGSAVIARAQWRNAAGWLAIGFLVCVVAYLLLSSGAVMSHASTLRLPLFAFATATPVMLWLTCRALFVDDFRLRLLDLAPLALLEVSGLTAFYGTSSFPAGSEFAGFVHQALAVVLYADAIWRAWRGYGGDLIDARRQFRFWFIFGTSTIGLAVAFAEIVWRGQTVPANLELFKLAAILALATGQFVWLLDPKVDWLATPFPASANPPADDDLPAGERQLLAALLAMVDKEGLYRREGLTIADLGRRVKAPERLVRRVINQRLGYRNFNAFLNERRIADAKAALADPARARIPVLTIALESGFASIGPFNRAFKEALGETPTEFRRRALSRTSSDPERSPQTGK